jgi:hypothetical protein
VQLKELRSRFPPSVIVLVGKRTAECAKVPLLSTWSWGTHEAPSKIRQFVAALPEVRRGGVLQSGVGRGAFTRQEQHMTVTCNGLCSTYCFGHVRLCRLDCTWTGKVIVSEPICCGVRCRLSPFSARAMDEGELIIGGKMDDVTICVAKIQRIAM